MIMRMIARKGVSCQDNPKISGRRVLRNVSNFLKLHTFGSPLPWGERIKVRGIYLETTLTPTLSR